MEDVTVKLVQSADDAVELLRWLGERRPILAVDTETCGLDWWIHPVRLVQFGDAQTGWAVPFDDYRGLVRQVLNTYTGPIVGHNLKFDLHMLRHWAGIEIPPSRWHCTMTASQITEPLASHKLKVLAKRFVHPMAAVGENLLDAAMAAGGWSWATIPITTPEYWTYGALDTVITARLHEVQQQMLTQGNLHQLYEMECRVMAIAYAMERAGTKIDMAYTEDTYGQLTVYQAELFKYCKETYGVNPASDDEIVSLLLRDGIRLTERTEKGNKFSVDKEVLGSCLHPAAPFVLQHRTVQRFGSTYFRNFINLNYHERLHAGIRPMGAKTGRMSVSRPPLQQLPSRENPVLPNRIVRDSFTATDPQASVLLMADFDQIEMRIFAHFAGETGMIEAIRSGIDLHTLTAQRSYGTEQPTKAQRSVAKNANFSKVYGAGVPRFAMTAKISVEEATAFMVQYEEQFPGVRRFQHEVEQIARSRQAEFGQAFVRAPSGRLHYCDEDELYKLVNYLVQGTAADVFKEALVNLDAAGLTPFLRLLVHDEVVMEVPREEVDGVKAMLPGLMENTTSFQVPLTTSVSGPYDRWGDAYA